MATNYWKQIKTPDLVRLFRDMRVLRSYYADVNEVVSMTRVWEDLASTEFEETDEFKTKIKTYSGDEEHNRKAGVIVFANQITLIVSEGFWNLARTGEMVRNFLLAHEFSHIALDHHAGAAIVKHFKFDSSKGINANLPPSWEEFEASVAAVLFQCGDAILDEDKSAYELARKFSTDEYYVGRLQRLCQSKAFKDELTKQLASKPKRVVL